MLFDVVLLKQKDKGFTAHPVLWPDAVVHGTTRQETMERVQGLIRELVGRTQVVQVEVEVPEGQIGNHRPAQAGVFAEDPTWDEFLRTMAEYRRQLDIDTAP